MRVAAAAFATFGNNDFFTRAGQVLEYQPGRLINHDGAWWHFNREIRSRTAVAVGRPPGLAVSSPPALLVGYGGKRIHARLRNEDHTPAITAISTIRTAACNVFFATETHASSPAVASNYLDLSSIDKHGGITASGCCRCSANRPVHHVHATTFAIEGHHAVGEGKKGVVGTHTNIASGMEFRAHLTNEDVAGLNRFTPKPLHSPTLRVGVATVAA